MINMDNVVDALGAPAAGANVLEAVPIFAGRGVWHLIPGGIRLQLWSDRSGKGVELSPEQAKEIGVALYQLGRSRREVRRMRLRMK
jgi:hypothetical protein